jgi:peptide subunit release factor 1 (eRF1)
VKNRHRKGGQSQRRFDRTREKQVHEHFEQLCEAIQKYLAPERDTLDFVLRGGDGRKMEEFTKECKLMRDFESKFIPRFLTVPEPRQAVLESLPREIWQCRLWQISVT